MAGFDFGDMMEFPSEEDARATERVQTEGNIFFFPLFSFLVFTSFEVEGNNFFPFGFHVLKW